MIHLGIIHAVHRVRPTIHQTIASLGLSGFPPPIVFADDGTHGAMGNAMRALKALNRLAFHRDYVCVVDDDLVVCKPAMQLVQAAMASQPEALTMYTVAQNLPHDQREGTGWISVKASEHLWGGMLLMRHDVARQVSEFLHYYLASNPGRFAKAPDAAFYHALGSLGVDVLHHLPSLTQDIGDGASTIGNEHTPETKGFRWEEWNENL